MTDNTTHLPLPWRVDFNRYDQEYRVYTSGSVPVINSMFRGKEAKADAELIVRAVNSHVKLVEALDTLLGGDDRDGNGHCRHCGGELEQDQQLCRNADCEGFQGRAALALARGDA
jgi:hypothetical protein